MFLFKYYESAKIEATKLIKIKQHKRVKRACCHRYLQILVIFPYEVKMLFYYQQNA